MSRHVRRWVVAVTAAILNGANLVRVHDVGIMKRLAAMADAIGRVR